MQFQQRFPLPLGQEIIYGLEYRLSAGLVHAIPTIAFDPARRTESLYAAFVQDEITLVPERLKITIGSKFEHNDYSGFEAHPSGRVAFTPFQHHLFWASVSRAVRTPSRLEQDLKLDAFVSPIGPTFARIPGDRKFDSEQLLATEAGYRFQPVETLSLDLATFYNRYTDLLSIEPGTPFREQLACGPPHTILPFFFRNNLAGPAYGAEIAADWAITDWWQLHGSYSFLKIELQTVRGGKDHNTESSDEGSSPVNQLAIRSYMDLPRNFELDVIGRYVEDLSAQRIGSYATLDVHLGWRPAPNLELAVVGQNLIEDHHAEFSSGGTTGVVAVRRTAYFAVTWRW